MEVEWAGKEQKREYMSCKSRRGLLTDDLEGFIRLQGLLSSERNVHPAVGVGGEHDL